MTAGGAPEGGGGSEPVIARRTAWKDAFPKMRAVRDAIEPR